MDLKPDPRNARRHDDRNKATVRSSLEQLGAGRSIVVDSAGEVIAGNCTLEQARALGLDVEEVHTTGDRLVVVVRDDLTPDDPRRTALALADNRTTDQSVWDSAAVKEALQSIDAKMAEAAGWTERDRNILFADARKGAMPRAESELVPMPCEVGQVWALGRHRLSIGDCRHVARPPDCNVIMFDPPFHWAEVYEWTPAAAPGETLLLFCDGWRAAVAAEILLRRGWQGNWEMIWDMGSCWYTAGKPLARHKMAWIGFGDKPHWDFSAATYAPSMMDRSRTRRGTIRSGRGAGKEFCPTNENHLQSLFYREADAAAYEAASIFCDGSGAQDRTVSRHAKPDEWIRALLLGVGAKAIWDMTAGSCRPAAIAEREGWTYHGCELDPATAGLALAWWATEHDAPELCGECTTEVGKVEVDPDPGRMERSRYYRSKAWRALREEVVAASGGKCSECGADVPDDKRHIDHIVPRSSGGTDDMDNLRLLCNACHCRKSGGE